MWGSCREPSWGRLAADDVAEQHNTADLLLFLLNGSADQLAAIGAADPRLPWAARSCSLMTRSLYSFLAFSSRFSCTPS